MDKIQQKNIVTEMESSFLDYAMSVIVARALPDVKDGLKPVQRRILYAMSEIGNYADKPYKKSARIVGDVIGKYHPHGDSSVYAAMVRMAQDFSYRNPLVDGHGNFGSIDGDGAAAMRYTEARMSKLAMELLKDIKKDTVDFQDNYDGTEKEPVVLPAKIPNLLINGANGIAVGMATNIPPHNITEVINGVIAYIKNREITIEDLNEIIQGPDFPLGGIILGDTGIKKAYKTGHGKIIVRSKYEIVDGKNKQIIIKEIPYQVNKAQLVEKIAEVVKNKIIEGIKDLRDESDKDGIRIVIELKQNVNEQVIINSLFKHTPLETPIAINMLALKNGIPCVLNLKEIIEAYVDHQLDVLQRKLNFELKKAEDKAHILKGLLIAVDNIDEIVNIIKQSENNLVAQETLMKKFNLTEIQAKSILDMQLKKLTALESNNLRIELEELKKLINQITEILTSKEKQDECIIEELSAILDKYKSKRRTEIIKGNYSSSFDEEDFIDEQNIIITLTEEGYIKRTNADLYKVQNRGGSGVKAMNTNENDNILEIITTTTHSDILFFTDTGRVFKIRAHKIPDCNRQSKGLPLVNLIDINDNEKINKIIAIKDYDLDYLAFVTKKGKVKITKISEFNRINKNGKKAINLEENDTIISVMKLKQNQQIIAATKLGKAIKVDSSSIRPQGRSASGVKLIKLKNDDTIINACVCQDNDIAFTLTKKGIGKASKIEEYRMQNRGGTGIKNINLKDNNEVVAFLTINETELLKKDLLIVTELGQMIRINAQDIKISGRATTGVKMINLKGEDVVAKIEIIEQEEASEE